MSRFRFVARIGFLCGVAALSACASSPSGKGQGQADAATRSACQQRAEEADAQRNRGDIYSPPPTVNTPYSGNFIPGVTDRGLSELFVHDRMISDCVRNTGTNTDRTQPSPPTSR